MNNAARSVLKASEIIEKQSAGSVKLTCVTRGPSTRWILMVDGDQQADMTTSEAAEFVRGWQLARPAHKP